jgi:tetratricopeptide (TPR) repeat protein
VREGFIAYYLTLAESISRDTSPDRRDYRPIVGEEPNLLAAAEALHAAGDWPGMQRIWPATSGYLWLTGDLPTYERLDRLCLDAARELGDEEWVAGLLSEIGYARMEAGQWDDAEKLFRESQVYYDAAPDRAIAQARLRRYRAQAASGAGDSEEALTLLKEAEQLLHGAPEEDEHKPQARMFLHSARMTVHHRRGELEAAAADGRATAQLHDRLYPGRTLRGEFRIEYGDILFRLGHADEAARQWQTFLSSRGDNHHTIYHAEAELRLAWRHAVADERDEAARWAWKAHGTYEERGQLARCRQIDDLITALEDGAKLPTFDDLFAL